MQIIGLIGGALSGKTLFIEGDCLFTLHFLWAFIFLGWPILEAWAEILQKLVRFMGDLKTPKFLSEFNWPLISGIQNDANWHLFNNKSQSEDGSYIFHKYVLCA